MRRAARSDVRRLVRRAVAAGGLALALASPAHAVPPAGPAGGATATRAVVAYQALEERLVDLAAQHDRAALEGLLDEAFAAQGPGTADPLDRAGFVAAELARARPMTIYALAVLERGELDLVSFLLRPERGARPGEVGYVVDVWRRADHRLLARYRSQPRRAPPPPSVPSGRS